MAHELHLSSVTYGSGVLTSYDDMAVDIRIAVLEFDINKIIQLSRENDPKYTCALYNAINEGQVYTVRQLIRLGADVNIVYKDGTTPLYRALLNPNISIIKLLLDAGAKIAEHISIWQIVDRCKGHPMAYYKLKLLVDYGMNLKEENEKGKNALGHALWDINCFRLLVEKGGANMFGINSCNSSILLLVAASNSIDIVQYIMDRTYDIKYIMHKNDIGFDAIIQAIYYKHYDAAEIIYRRYLYLIMREGYFIVPPQDIIRYITDVLVDMMLTGKGI